MLKKKLRLKIGGFKKDDGVDSPPDTPHSVAPPLSPAVDYELRTACALVLQDFKPSDYVYHERFGDADDDEPHMDYRTQLNYAAFMQAVEDGEDDEPDTPLDSANTNISGEDRRRSGMAKEAVPSHPQSPIPVPGGPFSDGLWKRVRGEQNEEEEESQLPPRQWVPKNRPPERSMFHKRSISHPIQTLNTFSQSNYPDRPRSAHRANSLRTPGSTPEAGGADLLASTVPPTAVTQPDSSLSVDHDWMRHALENHKQTEEEAKAHEDLEKQIHASLIGSREPGAIATPELVSPMVGESVAAVPAVRMLARKPVPRSTSDTSQDTAARQRSDSRPSTDIKRSTSHKRRSTPRSESRAELEMLRPESKQGINDSEQATTPPQVFHAVKRPVFRNTGIRAPAPSGNVSKAPSRSRSITRSIREFIQKPSSRTSSRKPSIEVSRPASRSRSMDSVRSAVSALSSNDYAPSKWKSFRPFHRNDSSTDNTTISRSDSKREAEPGSKPKVKPPINLNRELPPLPSLDKWKDEEPEPPVPERPAHITDLTSNTTATGPESAAWPQPQTRSQKPSIDSTKSQRPRDSVVNVTPPQPPLHPKRMSSLRAATDMSKLLGSNGDVAPRSLPDSTDALSTPAASHSEPSLQASPAELPRDTPSEESKNTGNRHISKFSTSAVARMNSVSGLRSKSSGAKPSPTSRGMSMDQMRSTSEQPNFSRKISSDDYKRGQDRSYQHYVDLSAPALPPKDTPTKKKKRWWQSSKSSDKRSNSWMDQVVKSGSRSGVLMAEDAGSPVARY